MSGVVDLRDERFRRDLEQLHRLGVRPLYEMLRRLGAERLIFTEIEHLVRRYARLDPRAVRALGGHRFAPRPSWRVP
jgi:hypothetical protein